MPEHADTVRDEHGCFVGHPGRECGEHRTTGDRAWCFDCSEWCYPRIPCVRCEIPRLRQVAADLADALKFHEERRINPTSRGGPALAAWAALNDGSIAGGPLATVSGDE